MTGAGLRIYYGGRAGGAADDFLRWTAVRMSVTDWEIERHTLVCAASGRELAEDEEIYSAIYDEGSGFVRRDYAVERWPPKEMERVFSFWKTRVPKRDAPVKRFVDNEVILDFFHRLEGEAGPAKRNFRYVLALLLMRKKALKFKGLRRGEGEGALVLYDRVRGRDCEVADPNLSEEEIERVTEEVGQVLNTRV